jgi:glycerol uptake facilitator-like aquaporin
MSFKGSLVQYLRKRQVALPSATDTIWAKRLGTYELKSLLLYKAATIELVGTTLLTFTSCATVVSVLNYGYAVPPQFIAVAHLVILAFFIISTAKSSGGHLNPMITFATMVTGFTTPTRAVAYILAQTIGAIGGAGLLRGVLNGTPFALGGCVLGTIEVGRALLAEAVASTVMLFVAFGTALDVGQRELFGPIIGPFFVSFTLGLIIYFGGGLVPGYSGPSVNPARCFGPAVISGNLTNQWIFWVGPLIGGLLIGGLYRAVPPSFNELPPAAEGDADDRD